MCELPLCFVIVFTRLITPPALVLAILLTGLLLSVLLAFTLGFLLTFGLLAVLPRICRLTTASGQHAPHMSEHDADED